MAEERRFEFSVESHDIIAGESVSVKKEFFIGRASQGDYIPKMQHLVFLLQ